jgi:putative transposase
MSIRYKSRYRVPSTRLVGWDYRQAGAYAVTVCTRNRDSCLGQIVADRVVLSPIGEVVAQEWLRIPRLRPSVTLDTWIIMPDHLHGILMLAPLPVSANSAGVEEEKPNTCSLGAVVGQFKKNCTSRIWARHRRDFAWQPRFYDQILRDTEALQSMRTYIQGNPLRCI